jgi:hypothetical protein
MQYDIGEIRQITGRLVTIITHALIMNAES